MSESANLHGGSRIKRLLETLWLLSGPAVWNRQTLAQHFDVSPRTVLRDIQLLRESGLVIASDEQTGGYLLAESRLIGGELSPLELLALALAPDLSTLPDLHFLRRYWNTAIGKLFTAIAPPQRAGIDHAINQIQNLADDHRRGQDAAAADDDPLFGELAEHASIELVEYWIESGRQQSPMPGGGLPQETGLRR